MNAQSIEVDTAVTQNAYHAPGNRFLLNTPNEATFLTMAATQIGNKALLGDHEKMDAQAGTAALKAQILLYNSVADIEALTRDETRNEYEKHEAARTIASRVVSQLEESKATIETRSETLKRTATEHADSFFAPQPGRDSLYSEIRLWVKEQAKTPDGMNRIRTEANGEPSLAAALYHSPSFLVGIAPQVHAEIRYELMQQHLPAAYKMLSDGVELQQLVSKYESTARRVNQSFFSPVMAAKAAKRVQI